MTNAATARAWLVGKLGSDAAVAKHFAAVSTNIPGVTKFGIDPANTFGFWDWVGGRYSMDSAIGLSTMIALGPDNFRAMLAGFHAMDEHFRTAPAGPQPAAADGASDRLVQQLLRRADPRASCPTRRIWRASPPISSSCRWRATASTSISTAHVVNYQTGPIIWGEPGTDGQHSFYQLIHQGTKLIPCRHDRLLQAAQPLTEQHDLLMANLFAQAEALGFGKTAEELKAEGSPDFQTPFRVTEGNRPTNMILADKLDPATLGSLVALYEHSVFTQGAIWAIDSFDQWGVELGKVLASRIIPELHRGAEPKLAHDTSTNALIARYRRQRG